MVCMATKTSKLTKAIRISKYDNLPDAIKHIIETEKRMNTSFISQLVDEVLNEPKDHSSPRSG